MVPFLHFSGYKKPIKWRSRISDNFENCSDNFQNKEVPNDDPRINAFLKKQISGVDDLVDYLVEEYVISKHRRKYTRHCILIFFHHFVEHSLKFENPLSSEEEAERHPETDFLNSVKILFYSLINNKINNNYPGMNTFMDRKISGVADHLLYHLVDSGLNDLLYHLIL
jgi:hypothetical protein